MYCAYSEAPNLIDLVVIPALQGKEIVAASRASMRANSDKFLEALRSRLTVDRPLEAVAEPSQSSFQSSSDSKSSGPLSFCHQRIHFWFHEHHIDFLRKDWPWSLGCERNNIPILVEMPVPPSSFYLWRTRGIVSVEVVVLHERPN